MVYMAENKNNRIKNMEHTKGKLRLSTMHDIYIVGPKGRTVAICDYSSIGPAGEVAKEFVRRWNAFEEDGMVGKLVDACKRGRQRLLELGQRESHRTVHILTATIAEAEPED